MRTLQEEKWRYSDGAVVCTVAPVIFRLIHKSQILDCFHNMKSNLALLGGKYDAGLLLVLSS